CARDVYGRGMDFW
nr:immunoglobulin heavy chain junction region [Macaca mulatta]MOW75754.1 immunoglobulin heavy chain junction region [Macaca mulatta]MOW75802.1 immunoglobulin heavy chain junction region [Macaca mulatta]MOW77623.1 immunoglobulin heavy chain junction region [Macaca mulatta]MOW77750.1 immunoglobulin heavy chain junction region [Macaca mulatta]